MDADLQPRPASPAAREDAPSDIDRAVALAADQAEAFARLGPAKKADLLDQVTRGLGAAAEEMVRRGCEAKGVARGSAAEAEEWFGGPCVSIGLARQHADSLRQVAASGRPRLAGWRPHRLDDGRLITHLKPLFAAGGVVESGVSFRVLHTEGTTRDQVLAGQGEMARANGEPGVTAVLGAGNVSSIPVADVIHSLFVENRTAVLKMNPVNAYLREPFEKAFAPLIEAGYVQIVDGGAAVGGHLVNHRAITHIHLTGSADTHDRIVWGPPGPEQAARKARGEPVLNKVVTSELGNVSPVLVTPYLYARGEIKAMAEMLATQITNNASFNCNAGKMLVLPKGFPQRKLLLDTLAQVLGKVPVRKAYYPGASERHARLTGGRSVVNVGAPGAGELPWSIVSGLDAADASEPLFSTEPFCSMLSVVEVGSLDPVEYFDQAVTFCNEKLWGTLSACLFVPPLFEDDGVVEHALERAIRRLEYGAVGVNVWPALVYATARAPWGGHPKATLADVQSGLGFVHNPLFLPRIEKTIVTAALVPVPRPPYVVGQKHALAAAKALRQYVESPALGRAFGVVKATLLG